MVTQLLFGETFEILAQKESWYCIKPVYDGYECWIDAKQCMLLHNEVFESYMQSKKTYATDLINITKNIETGHLFPILLGSVLPNFGNSKFRINGINYEYTGEFATNPVANRSKIIETAYLYLNAPYLWGGKTPFGIDCSGFTQIVYKVNGINIPRDAYQQADIGIALSFIEEAAPGDLAFFENKEGKISHVGIMLNNNKIIHASGKVRIDSIDHQGIFNIEIEKYTHKLRIIKRY